MKLVIHAGAHKTATTSIQHWLKQSVNLLANSKVLYLDPTVLNQTGIIEQLHSAEKSDYAKLTNKLLKLLSEKSSKSRVDTILLSHESIFSFSKMLPSSIKDGLYGSTENSAPCLNRLSDEYDLKVIFYVRRQDTFLASIYLEFVKRGNTFLEFDEYCSGIDYRNISWLRCLKNMTALMKNAEFVVMPYEIIESGTREFINAFIGAIGIQDNKKLLNSRFPKSNESISKTALSLMQACGPHLTARDRRSLGQYFLDRFPASDYAKAEILSQEYSQEIMKYFADENERMFKQWMPGYIDYLSSWQTD